MKHHLKISTLWMLTVLVFGTTTANAAPIISERQSVQSDRSIVALTPGSSGQKMAAERDTLGRISEDYRLALTAGVQKKYSQVIFYLNRAIAKYPTAASLYEVRGLAYFYLRQEDAVMKARADANTTIKMAPNFASGYFLRGLTLDYIGDNPNAAIADFQRAADLYKLDGDVKRYNVSINRKKQNLAEMSSIQRDNTQKVALTSGTTEQRMQQQRSKLLQISADYRLAKRAILDKKYSQALPYLTRAIAKYPNTVALYLDRSDVYANIKIKSSVFDDTRSIQTAAMDDAQTALKMEPNNPCAYLTRGTVYAVLSVFTYANEDFLKAARLYQVEGDVESYNAAMKAAGMNTEIKAIRLPPPLIMSPGLGGGSMGGDILNHGMNNANRAVESR